MLPNIGLENNSDVDDDVENDGGVGGDDDEDDNDGNDDDEDDEDNEDNVSYMIGDEAEMAGNNERLSTLSSSDIGIKVSNSHLHSTVETESEDDRPTVNNTADEPCTYDDDVNETEFNNDEGADNDSDDDNKS